MSGIQFRAVLLFLLILIISVQLSLAPQKPPPQIVYPDDQQDLQVFVAVIIVDILVDQDDAKNLEWARTFLASKTSQRWRYNRKVQYLGHTAFAFQLEPIQEILAME